MKPTATLIREYTSTTGADHRIYRLKPPYEGVELVVVSAVVLSGSQYREETMIFPSDGTGVANFRNIIPALPEMDHEEALRNLG